MVSTRISKTLIGVLIEKSDKFVKKKTLNSNLHLSFFIFFFFIIFYHLSPFFVQFIAHSSSACEKPNDDMKVLKNSVLQG